MRRIGLFTFTAITAMMLLAATGPTEAGWREHWDRFWLDAHRNNCYPEPFVRADRAAFEAPFAVQINKGWQLQNTMGDQHFDRETQVLTPAGELKLRWILTQALIGRRTVFVLRGADQEATSIRIDSVQQAAARILPRGVLPEILETGTAPRGWPADYIDAIDRKSNSSMPDPRLPAMSTDEGE